MSEPVPPNSPLPKWLEDQQHHSWQIEILIASGFIIFLVQLPDFFRESLLDTVESTEISSPTIILSIGGYLFSRALLIGFVVNLVLRAVWLAMLGVNFAYPDGIRYDRLKFSDYIDSKLKAGSTLVGRILRIEKACSLSYSITIIMTIMSLGIFIMLALTFLIISNFIPSLDSPYYGYFFMAFYFILSLGMLDHVFFGWLRKYKLISRIYYPFHRFYNIVSLSFLYRKEWLTITSHVRKWKIYLVFFVYFLLSFMIVTIDVSSFINSSQMPTFNFYEDRAYLDLQTWRRKFYNSRYENLRPDGEKVFNLSIQSDVIKDRYMKLFVVYRHWFDEALGRILNEKGVKDGDEIRTSVRNDYMQQDSLTEAALSEFFTVYIDHKEQHHLDWSFYDHPYTEEKGFITYIDIDTFASGKHFLQLWLKTIRADTLVSGRYRELPFIKE